MSDHSPEQNPSEREPSDIPILHGPITPAEQEEQEKREKDKRKDETENAFKERQITATEAANKLSGRNLILTGVTAIIATAACVGTWYQSVMNKRSWETANSTLSQMKVDSAESSKQFQVQLGHFDDGLG